MYNKNHIKLNEPDVFWSQWSFSADMVVLQPEQSYLVSVFNIPKPEVGHSNYDVSKKVSVPGEETTKESCFWFKVSLPSPVSFNEVAHLT